MTASDEILALLARVDEFEKAAIKDQSITEAWHLGHWKADMEFAREARKENALLNAALAESREAIEAARAYRLCQTTSAPKPATDRAKARLDMALSVLPTPTSAIPPTPAPESKK